MEGPANLILTEHVPLPASLKQAGKVDNASEAQKMQAAKDFESVFITKLLDAMKDTIGDWGLAKDAVSKQTQGIFWLYLGRDIANNGGFGMWKDISRSLEASSQTGKTVETAG